MNTYDVGDAVHLSVAFSDTGGAAVDPSAVTLGVADGDNAVTTYIYGEDSEVVRTAEGRYRADIPITGRGASGIWHYIWTASGNALGSESGYFAVRKQEVGA